MRSINSRAGFQAAPISTLRSSAALVSCPHCGSQNVTKALMSPSVSTARGKEATTKLAFNRQQKAALEQLRQAVKVIRETSEDVGTRFPEEARRIHYGEAEERGIIGQAKPKEVKALVEEGIGIAPLPDLPEEKN